MRALLGRVFILLALACAVHLQALGHGFHYDDFHSLVYNPHIRSLDNLPRFFVDPGLFSRDEQQAMYRPMLLVSYALNYAVGGEDPLGYHLFNLLLHAANVLLVLLLAEALGFAPLAALAAAVFLAVHALTVETVYYVSSRSELLMAFGVLCAALAYVKWSRSRQPIFYVVSLMAFAFALLSKSVGIALLVLLPLCDGLLGGRVEAKRQWRFHVPYWVVACIYLVVSQPLISRALLAPVRPLTVQFWTQIKAWVYYVMLGVMPMRLSVEHQFFTSATVFEPAVFAAAAFLLSAMVLLAFCRSRLPLFALLWSALFLLPASIVPLIVLVNEHRLYLSLVGAGLLLAWLFERLYQRRPRLAYGSLAVYTIVLSLLAFSRGRIWADEQVLWADAAAKGPLMLKPHLRLGDALAAKGDTAAAEQSYLRALALRSHHPAARNNLGLLNLHQGRLAEAEAHFRALLETSPDILPARLNLAALLLRRGDWQQADKHYVIALQYGDTEGDAQKKLGFIALHYKNAPQDAVRYYDAALALRADASTWVARGVALRTLGREVEAEQSYKRALLLAPQSADAWFNLGNLYRDNRRLADARDAYAQAERATQNAVLRDRARAELEQLKEP